MRSKTRAPYTWQVDESTRQVYFGWGEYDLPSRVEQLQEWVDAVKRFGLEEVRKVRGYHDEPLRGQRAGERSIRLSLAYRAIYVVRHDGSVEFVLVEEVNKHEY